jgi:copper(I)-binding protein
MRGIVHAAGVAAIQEAGEVKRRFDRRGLLQAGLAVGVTFAAPWARACEYYSSNLRVTHPWTRATAPGATSAVVCMRFDEVMRADRLIAVETPVAAGAEMGGTYAGPAVDFAIPEGQESVLSEAGTHVLLIGLRIGLEIARTYPLKLVFEKGDIVIATLNVDYARFK